MSINQTNNFSFFRPTFIFFLYTSLIWITILVFVFQPFFFNDENYIYNIIKKQKAWPAYLELCQYKPRIISNACVLYCYRHFSEHRIYFALLSVFFQAFSSAVIFLTLLKWLRLNIFACFLLGTGLAFIRFNVYSVYEFNLGLIEGLAQVFFSVYLYSLCALWDNYSQRNHLFSLLFAASATLCHERFIACFFPLFALSILNAYYNWQKVPKKLVMSTFFSFLSILLLPSIFHTNHALSGTGGQPLKLFSIQTRNQFLEIMKNMMGLNKGPEYLVGVSESTSPSQMFLSLPETIILTSGILVAFYAGWTFYTMGGTQRRSITPQKAGVGNPPFIFSLILLLTLVLPIIGVASMGIRVEMRWLLAPFQCLVIAILYPLRDLTVQKYFSSILGATALIAFMAQVPGFKNIYFVGEARSSLALGSVLSSGIFDGKAIKVTKDSDDVAWPDFIRRFPKVHAQKPDQELVTSNTVVLRITKGTIELQENVPLLALIKKMVDTDTEIDNIEQSLHVHQILKNPNLIHFGKTQIIGWHIDPLGISVGDRGLDVDSSEMWGWQEVPVIAGETLILVMGAQTRTAIPCLGRLQINWGNQGNLKSSWRALFTPSRELSYICDSVKVPLDIDAASFVLSGQDTGKISIIKACIYRIDNP